MIYPVEINVTIVIYIVGIFAIKKAMEFDEDKQVKQMCSIFYQMYLTDTKTKEE